MVCQQDKIFCVLRFVVFNFIVQREFHVRFEKDAPLFFKWISWQLNSRNCRRPSSIFTRICKCFSIPLLPKHWIRTTSFSGHSVRQISNGVTSFFKKIHNLRSTITPVAQDLLGPLKCALHEIRQPIKFCWIWFYKEKHDKTNKVEPKKSGIVPISNINYFQLG